MGNLFVFFDKYNLKYKVIHKETVYNIEIDKKCYYLFEDDKKIIIVKSKNICKIQKDFLEAKGNITTCHYFKEKEK